MKDFDNFQYFFSYTFTERLYHMKNKIFSEHASLIGGVLFFYSILAIGAGALFTIFSIFPFALTATLPTEILSISLSWLVLGIVAYLIAHLWGYVADKYWLRHPVIFKKMDSPLGAILGLILFIVFLYFTFIALPKAIIMD